MQGAEHYGTRTATVPYVAAERVAEYGRNALVLVATFALFIVD